MNKVSATLTISVMICLLVLANPSWEANASPLTQDEWPMFHQDPAHLGLSKSTGPATNKTLWIQKTNGQVWASAAVANGTVYIGSFDHNVYAFNASTGDLIWTYRTNGEIFSSPAVSNGNLYVGSFDHHMYALNALTGTQLWNFSTGGDVYSSPTVVNGTVYFGSDDNKVYALDARTGKCLWSYTTSAEVQSSAAVVGGVVYIGSNDTNIYALNASTGKKIWNFTTGSYVASSPTVANELVYVGSYDNNTYALNVTTGTLVWNRTTGYDICLQSSPAVNDDVLCTGASHLTSFTTKGYSNLTGTESVAENVYALNAKTGAVIWNYTTGGGVWSSPALSNNSLYVGSGDSKLYSLNAATGSLQWSYEAGGAIYSSPTIVNSVVYFGSTDNNVYAIGLTPKPTGSGLGPFYFAVGIITVIVFAGVAIIILQKHRRSRTQPMQLKVSVSYI